jgi:hypothetical protein
MILEGFIFSLKSSVFKGVFKLIEIIEKSCEEVFLE